MEACYNKEKPKPVDFDFVNKIFIKTIDSVDILMENDNIITSTDINLIPLPYRSFFGNGRMPGITPMDYLESLYQYLFCPPESYKLALIYIQKIIQNANDQNIAKVFNNISFYRMYLAAVVVAIKYISDTPYANSYYAQVGRLDNLEEMNLLEKDVLQSIDYKLYISKDEWDTFDKTLINDTQTKDRIDGAYIEHNSTNTQAHQGCIIINNFKNPACQT